MNPLVLVVTVCDDAAQECPYFPGAQRQEHWGFPDPSVVTGTEEERLATFRSLRDAIAARIKTFLRQPPAYGRRPQAGRYACVFMVFRSVSFHRIAAINAATTSPVSRTTLRPSSPN
jgi:hypothetical protein